MNTEFFEWGDTVTKDANEFVTLMPGKYTGKITKIEKKRWEGTGKMNGCPYAEVTVEATDGEVTGYVKDNLFLARSLEWKIGQFLHAFGLKEKDEPVKADRIMKALNKTCTVTVECQAGKEENYKTLSSEDAKYSLDKGYNVYNKIKAYESLESDDSEFGFDD